MQNINTIILDAGPIIRNDPPLSTLQIKSECLMTVPSVVSEIEDHDARSRMQTSMMPFLSIRTPSIPSRKFVYEFACKTGDVAVLSKTDLEVLALAYEVECERNGGDGRLRKVPGQKHLNGDRLKDHPLGKKAVTTNDTESLSPETSISVSDSAVLTAEAERNPDEVRSKGDQLAVELRSLSMREESLSSFDQRAKTRHEETSETNNPLIEQQEAESSDSDGWITPSNIKKHQALDDGVGSVPISSVTPIQVATITTDFAMQNVLLHIGLDLLSPSLQRIRNIRTYMLRCHACFEKVKDINKQFCPRCGKPTLTRVTCSTNANGEFRMHLKRNMQWNHRGNRYSVPKPVSGSASGKVAARRGGGKDGWGQSLILAEDQKEYQRAIKGTGPKEKGTGLMDEDYLPSILTGQRRQRGQRPKIGAGRNVNSKKRS